MKIFRNIFQTIWAIWIAILFFVSALPILIAFFLAFNLFKGRKAFNAGIKVSEVWSTLFMYGSAMPVSLLGKEKAKPEETYLFISNHFSQLDIPASFVVARQPIRFLSKKEVERMPVIGYPLKRLHLTVDRKNPDSRGESISKMKASLDEGISVIIFPEGTRNPGPGLTKNFYDGAFRLAVESKKPVIVQTIVDTWKRQNAHMGFRFAPGRIRVIYDGPIETAHLTGKDIPQLKQQVKRIMEGRLREYYGDELPVVK